MLKSRSAALLNGGQPKVRDAAKQASYTGTLFTGHCNALCCKLTDTMRRASDVSVQGSEGLIGQASRRETEGDDKHDRLRSLATV